MKFTCVPTGMKVGRWTVWCGRVITLALARLQLHWATTRNFSAGLELLCRTVEAAVPAVLAILSVKEMYNYNDSKHPSFGIFFSLALLASIFIQRKMA